MMLKKLCLCLLLAAAAVPVFADPARAVIEVPRIDAPPAPGALLKAELPWFTGFSHVRTLAPVAQETRFKVAHDGRNFYLAVEVFDDMSQITCEKYPRNSRKRTRNDNLSIDFDPDGRNMIAGKIIVDANGDFTDYWGGDDNTGTGRIVFTPEWNSNVKVISAQKLADRWTVELSIPIAAFFRGVNNLEHLLFNIGRERIKARENHSYARIAQGSFASSRYFAELKLKDFDAEPFQWLVPPPALKVTRKAGVLGAQVSGKLWNRSKQWRNGICRIALLDAQGKRHVRTVGVQADSKRSFDFDEPFAGVAPGPCVLEVQLLDTRGELLAFEELRLDLNYQPVRITLLQPAYRDNIYFTQKLDKIKAEVVLSENIGKPLTVTLTGPENFSRSVELKAAQERNLVEFDFTGSSPVGDYFLKAGECVKRIRKLPKAADEVRMDENQVTYINGVLFLPIGYSSIDPEWKEPGLTLMTSFRDVWRDGAELKRFLDRLAGAGLRGVLYPYIEPTGTKKVFGDAQRQHAKLTEEQKKLLAEAVAVCRNHPGLLAYYAGDEPEGHGHNEEWYKDLYRFLREQDPFHPVFLCHYGTEGMQRFHQGCDVIGADAYPDYYTDNTHRHPLSVCYHQVKYADALHRAPWLAVQTFDWALKSPRTGAYGRSQTYDEVREQMGLGLIADAKGFQMYIATMRGALSNQLRVTQKYIGIEVQALKEVLLKDTEEVKFQPANKDVFAGLKRLGKEFALVAVNTADTPVKVAFDTGSSVAELAVSGEKRSVKLTGGKFTDTIPPHRMNLYLTGGLPADSVDHQAVRDEIAKRDRERFRPGNLLAAGELNLSQIRDYKKGIIPNNVPKITVSSQSTHYTLNTAATQYFLQDGIRETVPMQLMTWTPEKEDKQPWIEVEFPKPVTAEKVVFYLHKPTPGVPLRGGRILAADADGNFTPIGSFEKNQKYTFEVAVKPVKSGRIRIELTDLALRGKLLEEIEIYGK